MKQKTKQSGGLSCRLHFPDDEKRLAWLALLPDAYSISDTGAATMARNSEEKKKRKICLRPEGVRGLLPSESMQRVEPSPAGAGGSLEQRDLPACALAPAGFSTC